MIFHKHDIILSCLSYIHFPFPYVSNFNSGRFFPLGDIWQYMETFIVSTTGEDGTTVSQ